MKRILKEQSNKDSVNNWDEAIKACSILQKTDGKKYKDKTSGVITLKQDNDDSVIIYHPDYTKKTIIKSTGKISDDTWDCPSYRSAGNITTIDDKEILDLGKEEKPELPKDEERKRKVCKKSIELLIQGANNFKRYDKNNKPSKKDFPFGSINDINKVKSVASRCVAQNNKFMGKEYYRDIEFLTTRLTPSEGKQNVDSKSIGQDFPMGLYQGLFSLINFKYEPGTVPKPPKPVKEPNSSNDIPSAEGVPLESYIKENNMKNIVRKSLLEVKNKKNSQLCNK
jgi:hypothetical protein